MATDTPVSTDASEPDDDSLSDTIMQILLLFRQSFLRSLGAAGVLMFLAGVALDGVLAGMFGIWGITFAGISVVAYVILTISRRAV